MKWIGWYPGTRFYAYKPDPNADRAQSVAPVVFSSSTDVGANYAWVVIADADGVERLERYAVRRR